MLCRQIVCQALQIGFFSPAELSPREKSRADEAGKAHPTKIFAHMNCVYSYIIAVQNTETGPGDPAVCIRDGYCNLIHGNGIVHGWNDLFVDGILGVLQAEEAVDPIPADPVLNVQRKTVP